MRITIDFQTFHFQNFGGISKYFIELYKHLSKIENVSINIPILYSSNNNLHTLKEFENVIRNPSIDNLLPKQIKYLRRTIFNSLVAIGLIPDTYIQNKKCTLKYIEESEFDIFHPSYFDDYFIDIIQKKNIPYVITVYDLIHEKFPEYFSNNDMVYKNRKHLLKYSSRIIAISNSTKKDIINYYGIDGKKINVIYLASNFNEISSESINEGFYFENYILFVGVRDTYKNFEKLLLAFAKIHKEFSNLKLISFGSNEFTSYEKKLISDLEIKKDVIHVPFKNLFQQKKYYERAIAFIFPSLYEGFGIPILEAFDSRCPVICSNNSSLFEISNGAAEHFDPSSVESIETSILKVLKDNDYRGQLIINGSLKIKNYSWEKTSMKTYNLYQEVIDR